MKIFRQLLREFWIPFLISLAWTAYSTWGGGADIKKIVSIFGPTFFLISWIVGQVFRVRKQVGVESSFTNVEHRLEKLTDSLERNVRTMVGHINGGDSFCYLMPNGKYEHKGASFVLRHCGEFPLFNLQVRIVDIDSLRQGVTAEHSFTIDEFSVTGTNLLDTPHFSESRALNIFYHSRSGRVVQEVRFAQVGDQRCYAYHITRDGEVLAQYLPEGFELDEEDKKSWLKTTGVSGPQAHWTIEYAFLDLMKAKAVSR